MNKYRLLFSINDAEHLNSLTNDLLAWFRGNARVLPWREHPEAYKVWVSEIMLQQTRVEAVKPYFERFTSTLRNVDMLAEAPDEILLKLWEGLGYYNRVRNMKKAAIIAVDCYGGTLPDSYSELLELPGIGSYTAGAIASIAYGKGEPAVDGNVLRVISRVLASQNDISDQSVKKAVEDLVRNIIPKQCPGAYNQALMEIGAMVCIPNGEPRCEECPLIKGCKSHIQGLTKEIPVKKKKQPRKIERKTILIIQSEKGTAVRKRPEKGLLAGLFEFPSLEGYYSEEDLKQYLTKEGLQFSEVKKVENSRHIFTHREWEMCAYRIILKETEDLAVRRYRFIHKSDLDSGYPVPAAFKAYYQYIL